MSTDKTIAEKLKQESPKENPTDNHQGANEMVRFIDETSDRIANQVADALQAAIYTKAMQQLGLTEGPLTRAAKQNIEDNFCKVLTSQLPALSGTTGTNGYYLTGQ